MAGSRKSSRSSAPAPVSAGLAVRVTEVLEPVVKRSERLVLGLSGGLDSVVLLDCLQQAARTLRFRLSALHVNHGLSPNASRWEAFCRRLCRTHGIPFRAVRVRVSGGPGPEAAARRARYEAFARLHCDYVVLAHHLDDQVETCLLQMLRGAGPKGLAAMPLVRRETRGVRTAGSPRRRRPAASILRPLLGVTRAEIRAHARARGLRWVEDESNARPEFARNYLRHEVLPILAQRFPGYRAAVARSARLAAEADEVLTEVAVADAAGCLNRGTLAVSGLQGLPPARARNLLRHFLATEGALLPPATRLEEARRQLLSAKGDSRIAIGLDGAMLRLFRGRVHLVKSTAQRAFRPRTWRGEALLEFPELGGALRMDCARGPGISLSRLGGGPLTVRLRRGGERLQPDPRRPRRTLKNLFQEASVPPWQRDALPLLYRGPSLVWVPGIGVDAAFQARKGERAIRPRWLPGA